MPAGRTGCRRRCLRRAGRTDFAGPAVGSEPAAARTAAVGGTAAEAVAAGGTAAAEAVAGGAAGAARTAVRIAAAVAAGCADAAAAPAECSCGLSCDCPRRTHITESHKLRKHLMCGLLDRAAAELRLGVFDLQRDRDDADQPDPDDE